MRLAFVYDRLNKVGGAERILKLLHDLWPQAPWYTSVYNPKSAPFAKTWDVRPSFMQSIPGATTHHELFPWLTPFAFESFTFEDYDVVISVTSAEAKAVITKPQTLHICYCLTPTRYLWSHYGDYIHSSPGWMFPLRQLLLPKLRLWDQVASTRPDHYLAISQTVKNRIHKYYRRDSEVIYPGIDTNFFRPSPANHLITQSPNSPGYFLVVSRLVPYKRIDLAIKACNQLKLPLKIVGTGSESTRLRSLAGPTIEFVGQLTDDKLLDYYKSCRALIFPGEEDFGLTLLEAQAVGKPVICYKGGGAAEIVEAGQTGVFFDTLTPSALIKALQSFAKQSFNPKHIRDQALKFDQKIFNKAFKGKVETLWTTHQAKLP